MGSTLALVQAGWRTAASYRIRMILSVASLTVMVVPVYFVAGALQPVMEQSIAGEGGEYFAFLVLGMVAFLLLPAAVDTMPGQAGSGINTGVLEALLSTPAGLPSVLSGMIGFNLLWTGFRAAVLLLGGWILGANLLWPQLGSAALILGMIVLAYLPVGMIATALVIAYRTPGPLSQAVLTVSALLGGVYYPTTVIPSWIESLSAFIPLTYGLRALRHTLLEGVPLAGVLPDLGMLSLFIAGLGAVGSFALLRSVRYARRAGTLTQY